MANSDATITRTALLKRAFRRIGQFNPSTSELSNAVDLLNDIVKGLDAEGKWSWTISNTPSTLTLVSSQRSYAAGSGASLIATNIFELEQAELVIGTSIIPLTIIDKEESLVTTLREGTGQPTLVFLEKAPAMTSQKLHFFKTPGATYTAQYTYRRRLYDFDNASDNPDFPQDWAQRLVKILSYELAPEYGVPLAERQLLQLEAQESLNKGLASNSPQVDPSTLRTTYY